MESIFNNFREIIEARAKDEQVFLSKKRGWKAAAKRLRAAILEIDKAGTPLRKAIQHEVNNYGVSTEKPKTSVKDLPQIKDTETQDAPCTKQGFKII